MYYIKFLFRFSDKYKERQGGSMDIGKTEYALAQASSYRNLNSAIISSYSTPAYAAGFSGLNAQLLYKIYDSMAITPSVLKSYYDKMTDADTEKTSTDGAETGTDAAATTADDATEEAADKPVAYQTQLGENRGYDYDRIKKIYDEMTEFYSKPENSNKTFHPSAAAGLDVAT
jgi:hypothetical protein